MFYNIIIAPIETVVDWVYRLVYTFTFNQFGVIGAIVGVSLIINFLALPLYNIADSLQEKERQISKKMEYRVRRIKKAFKGDEQFMILQEYYRQNNYHPLYVLRSSLSILIEIPFFIAAYHYLSNPVLLRNETFWIFNNLGSPDGLLAITLFGKAIKINVLPILMTAINLVSSAVYTKQAPLKEKIQLYVVAGLFLALLYQSPAGLVIYWILNNFFSLIKNIVMKQKHPGKILYWCIGAILAFLALDFAFSGLTFKRMCICLFVVCYFAYPFVMKALKAKAWYQKAEERNAGVFAESKSGLIILILSGIGLSLLAGFVLPASVISTSPIEFSFLGATDSPVKYISNTYYIYFGLFVFWPLCIYKMFGKKVRGIEPVVFFVLLLCALLNAYVLKANYGDLNIWFQIEDAEALFNRNKLYSLAALMSMVLAGALYWLFSMKKKQTIITSVCMVICLAELAMGIMNTSKIKKGFNTYVADRAANKKDGDSGGVVKPLYNLSKTDQNVIVLFLDRAMNTLFPRALEEHPELLEQYAGFTYYPNTLSFGSKTAVGSPTLMGGYDYTPEKINGRSDELLKDKHNEATSVTSILFRDGGYDVTVVDPPEPNYSWKGDLSYWNSLNLKNVEEIEGTYTDLLKYNIGAFDDGKAGTDVITKKEVKNFSMIQILGPDIRGFFNRYCRNIEIEADTFYASLASLYFFNELTTFDATNKTFTFIDNELPHRPAYLQAPAYEVIDPTRNSFEKADPNDYQDHYEAFLSAVIHVGKWLDYLRENNVFDNSRIIIVADHGFEVPLVTFKEWEDPAVPSFFNPLLLVKDFNSNDELAINNEFMTNADTLFIAKEGLGLSNVNPYTGKELKQEKEGGINVYRVLNDEWNVTKLRDKTQFTFDDKQAWHVTDNVFDKSNWITVEEYKNKQ